MIIAKYFGCIGKSHSDIWTGASPVDIIVAMPCIHAYPKRGMSFR